MAACRDCARPIVFVRNTKGGKLIPVEAAPDDDGNVVARRVAGDLHGHVLRKGEEPPHGWLRYMPHAAICEIQTRERRRRKPAPEPVEPLVLFDDPTIHTR